MLVAAKGKILFWEHAPEPFDLDALIAEMEEELMANPPANQYWGGLSMAFIKCHKCGKEVSDKAPSCYHCGTQLSDAENTITIGYPLARRQVIALNKCHIFHNGEEITVVKQGKTVTIECLAPMEIEGKVAIFFGRPTVLAKPGDKFNVVPLGLWRLQFMRVL